MKPGRFAARQGAPDANQAQIVVALRRCGASVLDLHAVGGGAPDLLVGWRGATYLLEVKTADGALRASQAAWAAEWRGRPAVVVRSAVEALSAIGIGVHA